jgi:aldehyde:ferredoxin oxidoreductase
MGGALSGNAPHCVSAKSPLTGHEQRGRRLLGPELKFAGSDAVVIRGRSPTPTYLWIHDGQ